MRLSGPRSRPHAIQKIYHFESLHTEEYYVLDYNTMQSTESQQMVLRKSFRVEEEQDTSMTTGGKQWLEDYILTWNYCNAY
jgi:hypothetical protein